MVALTNSYHLLSKQGEGSKILFLIEIQVTSYIICMERKFCLKANIFVKYAEIGLNIGVLVDKHFKDYILYFTVMIN